MIGVRIIVVGSGVIGLLTAMECARAGAQVSLVDQGEIPSPWATSYDSQRVVRALHAGDAVLTRSAARLHDAWLDVERRTGVPFYHQVGSLTALPPHEARKNLVMLREAGVPARVLSPGDLADRYRSVRFREDHTAILEPTAGVVLADRALTAIADCLRGMRAVELHPGREVVSVDERGGVQFADGTGLTGDRVVLATGPWSRQLLPAALTGELTLYRQSILSYSPVPSRIAWVGTPAIPSLGTSQGAWLIPPVGGTPVRLSAAGACRAVAELTDRETPASWRDHLVDHFSTLLVGFDPAAVIGARDGYYLADTAGAGPLLATFGDETTWAYAACGGMSFKFAPLVAGAVADRVLARTPRRTGLDFIDRPRRLTDARREEMTP
ncbi:MAG TPA: FAD-dependent oxidoreductase [Kribbella sp.]|nr:FAD-dependent oxidoreductase [Kribbella sp.]